MIVGIASGEVQEDKPAPPYSGSGVRPLRQTGLMDARCRLGPASGASFEIRVFGLLLAGDHRVDGVLRTER